MKKNTFELAGHTFSLKHIQYGIHSEETVDFMADLFCDGRLLCSCENDGHGGNTFTRCYQPERDRYYEVLGEVGKEVWLRCQTGDILYYDLGTVADELISMNLLHDEMSKYQDDALVFQNADKDTYDPYLRTKPLGNIKRWVEDSPSSLAHEIAKLQDEGWEVLNSNIPDEIYEAAKEWRLPRNVKGRNKWRFPCDSQ